MIRNNYTNTRQIVTIGAGASGISFTKEMVRRGYKDILTLEARDRIGGRIYTDPTFGDLGGMEFHLPGEAGSDKNLYGPYDVINFAHKNNFKFDTDEQKFAFYRNGKKVSEKKIKAALTAIRLEIDASIKKINAADIPKDISLETALPVSMKDDLCRSLVNTVFSTTDAGLDADDISLVDYSKTLSSAAGGGMLPEKGMGTLLNSYARDIKKYISLSKEVVSINHHTKSGLIAIDYINRDSGSEDKHTVFAEKLAISVPIGVLQSWIKSNVIELPKEKAAAINSIKMGTLNKIILKMDEKFFDENGINDNSYINIRSNKLNKDANFYVQKPNIIMFVGGKKSIELEHKGRGDARNYALRILASTFGERTFDLCEDSTRTKWNTDPFSLGAYSAATLNNFDARKIYSEPMDGRIFFVGEAYYDKQFSLHTHIPGALYSGYLGANDMVKAIENSRSSSGNHGNRGGRSGRS